MKRLDMILLKIFLWGLPVVICGAVLGMLFYDASTAGTMARSLNSLLGLLVSVWMVLTVYLSVRLLGSESFREKVLARITFIKERDEREVLLTGRAVKTAFLTSLALLILLLCLSCFQVSLYRLPPEKAIQGKTGVLTLGLGFHLLEDGKAKTPAVAEGRKDIFSYTGLPVTTTTVILILIIWQIVTYNFSMRRLSR